MPIDSCAHCGGGDLVRKIRVVVSVPDSIYGGAVGLQWFKTGLLGGYKTAEFVADLCKKCGTISRLYVDDPDRAWDICT
jgi:hypothetical protein